jgi:signal peptidase II
VLRRPAAVLAAVAAGILLTDQASKALVRATMSPPGTSIPVVGSLLRLTYVRNTGAAFGMFPGHPVVFVIVSLVVLSGVAVYWWRVRPARALLVIALGLVSGGATGNLIDRVTAGRVTDFLEVPYIPVFNVADSAIVVGVGLLMGWLLFGPVSHEAATGILDAPRNDGDRGASDEDLGARGPQGPAACAED